MTLILNNHADLFKILLKCISNTYSKYCQNKSMYLFEYVLLWYSQIFFDYISINILNLYILNNVLNFNNIKLKIIYNII